MQPTSTRQEPPATTARSRSSADRSVRSVLVATALLAVSTLGAFAVVESFAALQPALGLGESFALTFVVGGSLATLWLALVGAAYVRVRPVQIHYDLRWPAVRDLPWLVGGLVAIVVASLLIELAGGLLGAGTATNISSAAAVENPVVIYTAFIVVNLVFIAPVEEFLFRGVVQGRLRESFGPIAAITITAAGFGLAHIPSYWFGGSDLLSVAVWAALLSIAATGAVMGWVYERTESLLVASLLHGLVNTVGISLALAAAL
jgi:membrane protease YdiL (CAAX protease family)